MDRSLGLEGRLAVKIVDVGRHDDATPDTRPIVMNPWSARPTPRLIAHRGTSVSIRRQRSANGRNQTGVGDKLNTDRRSMLFR